MVSIIRKAVLQHVCEKNIILILCMAVAPPKNLNLVSKEIVIPKKLTFVNPSGAITGLWIPISQFHFTH